MNADVNHIADRMECTAAIRRSLELLRQPGDVFEIRALDVPSGRYRNTASGYFNDLDKAARFVRDYDEKGASGVYVTLNPVSPALLARANNRMVDRPKATTQDAEILRRQGLFIDIDPERPSGIAATDTERQTASELAGEIEDLLRSEGWPYPLIVDSGNGCYLLYRVDLPNDDETTELLKAVYGALNESLGTYDPSKPHSKIDAGVHNAARILRVGGTTNRKGDPTEDRPHRRCQYHEPIDECPVDVVPVERIKAFVEKYKPKEPATAKPTSKAPASSTGSNGQGRLSFSRLDVPRYLTARGVEFRTKNIKGGTAFLVPCPFDESHGRNGESAVVQADNGLLTFECKHNSCQGRQWRDYRDAKGAPDPDHWDPPLRSTANGTQRQADDQQASGADNEPPTFTRLLTSQELLELDLRPRHLVKNVLVQGQPAVIGGRSKALKTSMAIDLVVSLGSGTDLLGHFLAERVNVAFWSGESGVMTIKETARRIAKSKDVELADYSILWGFDLPKLTFPDHLQAMADTIADRSIDVAVVDPLYLSLLTAETAGQAGNVFAMGSWLQPLGEIGQHTGCTIIVLHHFRKTGQPDPDEPAALEELSQSGIAEWVRQWILLQRRSPYQADGRHELWMRCGGSAGHAGLYAIDIDEGIYDPDKPGGGRHWGVDVRSAGDAREEVRRDRERRKVQERAERDADDRRKMLEATRRCPAGETQTELAKLAGISGSRAADALRTLIGEGRVERCEIKKHTRMETGYKATGK